MYNNTIVSSILLAYEEGKATRDPRTRYWFLLDDNPLHVWILTALYVAFVLIGPKVMKNRKPFNLQTFMVVYNFGLVLVSLYLMIEIIASAYDIGYFKEDPLCCKYNADTPNDPKELRIANVFWWYFLSKLLEFMDTIVMVLRKKNDQITFLHVYHHSSMLNIWWWVTTYLPGGQSWFSSSLNCSVHVIMYLYYALAAIPSMRSKLWWKKYITKYQLIQFVLILYHTLQTTYTGCDYPKWGQYLLTGYMISMLVLFGNFYLNAYIKKRRLGAAKKTEDSSNDVVNNGVHKAGVNGHTNGHRNGHSNGTTGVVSH